MHSGWKNLRGRDHSLEIRVNGRILTWILRKQGGVHSSGSEQSPGAGSHVHGSDPLSPAKGS